MELGLAGKGALVTGASKGIGKAVAWALAEEGVDVAMCARNGEELERAAKEIEDATGRTVVPIAADMGNPDDIRRFVAEAAKRLGRIDILVNNAGAAQPGFVLDLSDEAFVSAIQVKLLGYVRCAREVVPHMRHQGGGCIVMIAGGAGRQPTASMAAPGITNAGAINFTKALADAVAKEKIRVVAISPGLIHTERAQLIQETSARQQGVPVEEVARRAVANTPLARFGETREIADMVLFLASDQARFVTGTHIAVDGGAGRGAF
ncbi:MAG: SDR family NAD(P)-dependent oxidoreductase [Dehalococcoidia bacterium]